MGIHITLTLADGTETKMTISEAEKLFQELRVIFDKKQIPDSPYKIPPYTPIPSIWQTPSMWKVTE